MGIFSQRRWRQRGVKQDAPPPPQLPVVVSREFHLDEIAKLTRSYELRLSEAAKASSGEGQWISADDLKEYQEAMEDAEEMLEEARAAVEPLTKEVDELREKVAQLEAAASQEGEDDSPEGDKPPEGEDAPAGASANPVPSSDPAEPEANKKKRSGKKS